MFWADKIAKEIIDSGTYKPYWVDDMFTPSGFAHIGSLRGPLVHDILYRALKDAGQEITSTYVFNDFDPIDGLPPELMKQFENYLGFPLRTAPPLEEGYDSFAHYFLEDFKKVLTNLGMGATFLSSWDMYHAGKFDEVIRESLDNAEKIQNIYQKVSGSKKRDKGWLPLQVICEKCGKLGTTRVHNWDGKVVEYICEPKMVTWAVGCGYTGKTIPFTDPHNPHHHPGKLPWKVDWPAHWKVLGVTIEGAGKDHSSAGGSRDIAKALCEEVFHIENPYNIPYEFFLIGGKKMSSSKGLGLKARDLTSILPPSVGRFLFTRTDYRQAIEIDPVGTMAIPDLFDEYDRCWQAYNVGGDENSARAFALSQIGQLPERHPHLFLPRFRDIANYIQLPNVDLQKKCEELKGSKLTVDEVKTLKERENYARVWIGKYAPKEYQFHMTDMLPAEVAHLSEDQKKYLLHVVALLEEEMSPDNLQIALYNRAKDIKLDTKQAFAALYTAILGRTHGPKAAWFLLQYPREKVMQRLRQAAQAKIETEESTMKVKTIKRPDLITIDQKLRDTYPSMTVGVAVIRGITIEKRSDVLTKEIDAFLSTIKGLTTEALGTFPEIISYRKLYKEMGVDWHSRRPSPEALLRRFALGKGLYTVNTCVDAYNMIVMKHRISVGAFDLDQIHFPTVVRFAKKGETIHLLGDEKPIEYTESEIAYFDQVGGYNMDFNYRDAQRTKVTQSTKNLWINVEGVFDITQEQVERSLKESVDSIVKYCGGRVEFEGIIV